MVNKKLTRNHEPANTVIKQPHFPACGIDSALSTTNETYTANFQVVQQHGE